MLGSHIFMMLYLNTCPIRVSEQDVMSHSWKIRELIAGCLCFLCEGDL